MVLTDVSKFDSHKMYLLEHKIKHNKTQYAQQAFLNQENVLKGPRYNDDSRIVRMILGEIYAETGFHQEIASHKFKTLTSKEADTYIVNAILESAMADYYYENEKEW